MRCRRRNIWRTSLAVIALAGGLAMIGSAADAAPNNTGPVPVALSAGAPPLPSVRTNVEPGVVDVDKLNKKVKNASKRKQLANRDRQKYGLVSFEKRGHVRKIKK